MPLKLPRYCHRKRAKGRSYYYFDTGTKKPNGKPILAKLPDYASNGFGRAYAACLEARENRGKGKELLTVPAFCEKFRNSLWFSKKAPNTQRVYLIYLRKIEHELNTFLASDVTQADAAALHAKLAEKPGAANTCIRTLGALYSWGKKPKIKLVSHNPAEDAEFFEEGEHEPWPTALLNEVLTAEDENTRLAANLLYYTAQRIGDVRRIKWTDIRDGQLFLTQEKTGKELEIPVHSSLRAALGEGPRIGYIIAKANGRPYSTQSIRKWLIAFAADRGEKFVPHGIRKNAVNALLEAGCTVPQTQAISGHSLQMIEHYSKKRDVTKLGKAAILTWENAS